MTRGVLWHVLYNIVYYCILLYNLVYYCMRLYSVVQPLAGRVAQIWRFIPKSFNLVPGVPGFSWDPSFITLIEINPTPAGVSYLLYSLIKTYSYLLHSLIMNESHDAHVNESRHTCE